MWLILRNFNFLSTFPGFPSELLGIKLLKTFKILAWSSKKSPKIGSKVDHLPILFIPFPLLRHHGEGMLLCVPKKIGSLKLKFLRPKDSR